MEATLIFLFFIVLPAFFIPPGVLIYLYLVSLFSLVEHIEKNQPALWKRLGSPQRGETCAPGMHPRGTQYYISPFMPTFQWLMAGDFRSMDSVTREKARRVRALFFYSTVAFIMLLMVTVLFIFMAESS